MMDSIQDSASAPVLSTPADYVIEKPNPEDIPIPSELRLDEEQLYVQYEIRRTVEEIRAGRYRRIALQFPDDMLVDAPRIFNRLREELRSAERIAFDQSIDDTGSEKLEVDVAQVSQGEAEPPQLFILGDTSYGACCVDEVAAEHASADIVVHYGRSCLSPTARLPVIYVFTSPALDIDHVAARFRATFPNPDEKICLMADVPYSRHLTPLADHLRGQHAYSNLFVTETLRDPSSLLPNRTIPSEAQTDPAALQDYSIFHIAQPPSALLLILASRINKMYIYPTTGEPEYSEQGALTSATTMPLLRRRYAALTRLATAAIIGILINTLSVKNYMAALRHCQALIAAQGKKSHVFVVGKINAAKLANFAEIDGWVVVGCWESSLVDGEGFWKPVITPFELEVALTSEKERVWAGKWVGDFAELLKADDAKKSIAAAGGQREEDGGSTASAAEDDEEDVNSSDDEPPEFDLRTGRYVSRSRPMGRSKPKKEARENKGALLEQDDGTGSTSTATALVPRSTRTDVSTIAGQFSPAAEFLRTQRTWRGLGNDDNDDSKEIAYERDAQGKIVGAAMEEGRAGVAKGYTVGESARR